MHASLGVSVDVGLQVGSRTKFRAAVDAVRVLSTEHRHYLAKQSVPPTHQDSRPSGPSQESGGKVCTHSCPYHVNLMHCFDEGCANLCCIRGDLHQMRGNATKW